MAYERVNWENGSSGGTPLSAENLNRMDLGIANASQKADICTTINIGGTNYPLVSIRQATISGVQGWIYTFDNGTTDGLTVFFADQTGLSTVKAAIEAQIPTGVVYVADFDEGLQGYVHVDIGTNGYYMPNKDNFDQLSALVAQKVNTSAVKSTITASDTNPVNSVAVIAYINSLDATNTLY